MMSDYESKVEYIEGDLRQKDEQIMIKQGELNFIKKQHDKTLLKNENLNLFIQ